jgi:HTH-type transcriptional regulator/antitoxin HigA
MSSALNRPYEPDFVSPPGETIQETLDALGMSQVDLAERTGKSHKGINEIVQSKVAITPETALQLERVLGVPAHFWLNLDVSYREWLARRKDQETLSEDEAWLKTIPWRSMVKPDWIPRGRDPRQQLEIVLSFFAVASPKQWRQVWQSSEASFRKSPAFESEPGAVAAWLRKGEIEGQKIETKPFQASILRGSLKELRALTVRPAMEWKEEATRLCADAGVACVFVPELPKTRACGATRWLTQSKALLQLSLRYRSDDHLWFTFFHEAGHILIHGKKDRFLEGDGADTPKEAQADKFAADFLIPENALAGLRRSGPLTKKRIREFASSQGIAPGIVVGRLQHERLLLPSHCNDLKQRFVSL